MRRDMDLIRAIVLKLESWELTPGPVMVVTDIEKDFPIEGYTAEQIGYHIKLITDEGWIDSPGPSSFSMFTFRSLTWQGHEFADTVRDNQIWAMTKEGALKAGGFSLDLLIRLAKGFAKTQLEKHTGIEL